MNKAFEKILERLEELKNHYRKCCLCDYNDGAAIGLEEGMSIVRKVAEEYNDGWIPCSGCKECHHKECEHYGEV